MNEKSETKSWEYRKRDSANLVRVFMELGSIPLILGSAYFAYRSVEIHEKRIEALESWRYEHSVYAAGINAQVAELQRRYNDSERTARRYRREWDER